MIIRQLNAADSISSKKNSTINKCILKYIFIDFTVGILLIILGFINFSNALQTKFDGVTLKVIAQPTIQYVIIIDAGSTGSRISVFEFQKNSNDERLILNNELYKETEPGLSSYVDSPEQGAKTIDLLLDNARLIIPKEFWHITPLSLKATAGLRLLDTDKAEMLLGYVREIILNSGFQRRNDSVEIMNGTDEGIFSWITLNFHLDSLNNGNNTNAALDLGGGSTQVTFVPKIHQNSSVLAEYIHSIPLFNGNVDLFTHSYLRLGMLSARHLIFSDGYPKNETIFISECVSPTIEEYLWEYGNVEYIISGKNNTKSTGENPIIDFDECLGKIRKSIIPLVIPKPPELQENKIYAFSYYFDVAATTGLIDPLTGGEIFVSDFMNKASEICIMPNANHPFICIDLLYIGILLEDGFGLAPKTKIELFKYINGYNLSWALGCALNLLYDET